MLQRLQISNYAIIDGLSVNFANGLNIITGETGAGKSILTGALDLILGKRADTGVLKHKEKKCLVEAEFSGFSNELLRDYFIRHELDDTDEIIVRREISAAGKSRSFVNDSPVTLAQLKELGGLLVDMHRQFDTPELSSENFQREVIDALANNRAALIKFTATFKAYTAALNRLEALRKEQGESRKEADYNQFLADEFFAIQLKENELENLDAELKLLSNAETIKQQLTAIYTPLVEGDEPLVQQLKVLSQKFSALLNYHPAAENLQKRLVSAQLEIADVADELALIEAKVNYDPARIDEVNERLNAGYRLLKKHGVQTTAELLRMKGQIDEKLAAGHNISADIEAAEKESVSLKIQAQRTAGDISAARKKVLPAFIAKVNELLIRIGMPNARLQVEITDTELNAHGRNSVNFLFDANTSGKNQRFEPLHKVASGGELSRLMLSVKSLVANKLELPVLIFDEIDTGISGEAARQAGNIMKELSAVHQVIAITHQPQIAAKASSHYFVYKAIENDTIVTSVKLLNGDERILSIAKMLSGEKPTAAALANAREMMN